MRRCKYIVFNLFIVACSSPPHRGADRTPRPIPTYEQLARQGETPCDLMRWEDGDTAYVRCQGSQDTVRLIGIDTAESAFDDNSKRRGQRQAAMWGMSVKQVYACGKAASHRVEELCLVGSPVFLAGRERDHYGRRLAYIRCRGININLRLVEEGLAGRYPYPGPPEKPTACPLP